MGLGATVTLTKLAVDRMPVIVLFLVYAIVVAVGMSVAIGVIWRGRTPISPKEECGWICKYLMPEAKKAECRRLTEMQAQQRTAGISYCVKEMSWHIARLPNPLFMDPVFRLNADGQGALTRARSSIDTLRCDLIDHVQPLPRDVFKGFSHLLREQERLLGLFCDCVEGKVRDAAGTTRQKAYDDLHSNMRGLEECGGTIQSWREKGR